MATTRNVFYPPKTDEEIEANRLEDVKTWEKLAKKRKLNLADFEPGTTGCHEAIHASSIILDSVARHLLDHPAIVLDPVWYRHAFRAHEELFRLYQEMGAGHLSVLPDDAVPVKPVSQRPRKKANSSSR